MRGGTPRPAASVWIRPSVAPMAELGISARGAPCLLAAASVAYEPPAQSVSPNDVGERSGETGLPSHGGERDAAQAGAAMTSSNATKRRSGKRNLRINDSFTRTSIEPDRRRRRWSSRWGGRIGRADDKSTP